MLQESFSWQKGFVIKRCVEESLLKGRTFLPTSVGYPLRRVPLRQIIKASLERFINSNDGKCESNDGKLKVVKRGLRKVRTLHALFVSTGLKNPAHALPTQKSSSEANNQKYVVDILTISTMMMVLVLVLLPLRLLLITLSLCSSSSSSSSTAAAAAAANDEATRYSTLPPTVFAPGGRLFGVERVAREAVMMMMMTNTDNDDGDSCCTVFAIHCGGGGGRRRKQQLENSSSSSSSEDSEEEEFTIMVGIGPISPSLHRDNVMEWQEEEEEEEEKHNKLLLLEQQDDNTSISSVDNIIVDDYEEEEEQQQQQQRIVTTETQSTPFCKSLLVQNNEETSSSSISISQLLLPMSILSPTLITATGGTSSIDSSILLRRSIEVALSLYKLDNGGIDFFASHSLEGMMTSTITTSSGSDDDDDDDDDDDVAQIMMTTATRRGGGGGGASGVKIETLVRRIADMAQSSTQNLGGKYGRMLSSSLLAMGVQQQQQGHTHQQEEETSEQQEIENNNNNNNNNNACLSSGGEDTLCIWRVDPTGQFWKCEASAVGRGTVEVEAELLSRVRLWKKKKTKTNIATIMADEDSTTSEEVEQPTVLTDDDDDDDEILNEVIISNEDVRSYLGSLTEDEAVRVASDCLVNGIMNCKGTLSSRLTTATSSSSSSSQGGDNDNNNKSNNEKSNRKQQGGGGGGSSSLRDWMEYDLRKRMQCIILRSCGGSSKSYEIVQRLP